MLNHTSGLPDFSESEAWQDALRASLEEAPPPSDLWTYVADEPLNFPPGTQYRYSNTDNVGIALMIEQATGQEYADALAEHVLEPLGLDETSLPSGTEIPEPFIHGYEVDAEGGTRSTATSSPPRGHGHPAEWSRPPPTSMTSSAVRRR